MADQEAMGALAHAGAIWVVAEDGGRVPHWFQVCSYYLHQAQGVIEGVAHSKHPLIAPGGSHAQSNLISQFLKCQPMVRCGESARDRGAGAGLGLVVQESLDGFLKSPLPQMGDRRVGRSVDRAAVCLPRKVETINSEEKKKSANRMIEIG